MGLQWDTLLDAHAPQSEMYGLYSYIFVYYELLVGLQGFIHMIATISYNDGLQEYT